MNWLDKQVSLYSTHVDNMGEAATYREILLSRFGSNIPEIVALRQLDKNEPDYKVQKLELKSKLQCFTPAALLGCKRKGAGQVIERTGVMQLDFDYNDIKGHDIEQLKEAVFSLPCICFCGLSCSGDGFYALVLIEDPGKLSEYAEHCFEFFKTYGIQPDESKGKKVENLRYISYDANMLIRENPEPLQITHFKRKEQPKSYYEYKSTSYHKGSNDGLVHKLLCDITQAQVGQRWATVQRSAYTIGGLDNPNAWNEIKSAIINGGAFAGEEEKYLKCAEVCFKEGSLKPI